MEKTKNEEIELDFIDIFYLLKSRLWIILLSAMLLAATAGSISHYLLTPIYTSSTKLYILTKSTSITSLADIQLGTQLTQDYMVLIKSRPVVTNVIDNLGLNMTYEQLSELIDVSNPSNTRILEIKADYPDATVAKQIVDEFAKVSVSQIATIMDTKEPTIVEEGYASTQPSSPNTVKNTVIGGIIGAFLAAGIIVLLHLMNDTIRDSEDIEKYLGLTTIGLIPVDNSAMRQTASGKKIKRAKAEKGMR